MGNQNDYGIGGVEGIAPVTIAEFEEHGHIGGVENQPAFKQTFAPPIAYKSFPTLTANYTYHAIGPVGAASGASLWRVLREDKSSGTIEWANGNAKWINSLTDVTSLPYS